MESGEFYATVRRIASITSIKTLLEIHFMAGNAQTKQDEAQILTTSNKQMQSPGLDAKAERRFASDLVKIKRYAPQSVINQSEYLFRTGTSNPDKAHSMAVLVTSKAFQGFDPTIQEFIFHTALALGQNWTKDSVVKLKAFVTSENFANKDAATQTEMLNKFMDRLLPSD